MKKIAVVTGANRGLGFGTVKELAKRGYEVLLLGRNLAQVEERAESLRKEGFSARAFALDLARPESIEHAAQEISAFPISLLVNNAGVFLEKGIGYDPEVVRETMQVNVLGPLQFTMELAPVLKKNKAQVVNVSSGMGSLSEMGGGTPGYRLSKTALNAVTRNLAVDWQAAGVRVNSVCPGWVRTEMGGEGAERSIEQGVASILAVVREDAPSGGFFRDGKPVEW